MRKFLLLLALFSIAARPIKHTIYADNTIYGGYTTVYLTPSDRYEDALLLACYIPDINGQLVFADWYPTDNTEVLMGPIPPVEYAPIWPKPWLPGPGECIVSQGYRKHNGDFAAFASTVFYMR